MAWWRIDDGAGDHPKFLALEALGPARYTAAVTLWFRAGCYCSKHRTDGVVPRPFVEGLRSVRWRLRAASDLVSVGLWLALDQDSWRFHDWTHRNPTRAELDEKRAKTRDRVARWRGRGNAVTGVTVTPGRNTAPVPARPVPINPPGKPPAAPSVTPAQGASAPGQLALPSAPNDQTRKPDSAAQDGAGGDETKKTKRPLTPAQKRRRRDVRAVWEAFRKTFKISDRIKLTEKRRKHINARLSEGYTVEQLGIAAYAASRDQWVVEKGKGQIEHVYRNAANVDRYMQKAQGPLRGRYEPLAGDEYENTDVDQLFGGKS